MKTVGFGHDGWVVAIYIYMSMPMHPNDGDDTTVLSSIVDSRRYLLSGLL